MLVVDTIRGVLEAGDAVGFVDVCRVDFGEDGLREEDLADVGDGSADDLGGADLGVVVRSDVDVGGAALVPAGEVGRDLDDAFRVGLGEPAGKGETGGVLDGKTGVFSGRVAVPEVHYDVGEDGAGRNVDDLDVEEEGDSGFAFADVVSDEHGVDVCE